MHEEMKEEMFPESRCYFQLILINIADEVIIFQ